MKREVSLDPGLSTQSCTHSLPGRCVEGCVVQLCEARGCVDEDERSGSRGLCAGVSTVNLRKGSRVVKSLPRWQTLTELGTL